MATIEPKIDGGKLAIVYVGDKPTEHLPVSVYVDGQLQVPISAISDVVQGEGVINNVTTEYNKSLKKLSITGATAQLPSNQIENYQDYFTNLDNYIHGDVSYTYVIPFPDEWIGNTLTFSLIEKTKMTDISFDLADGTGLLANTYRLLDYNGNIQSAISNEYTYFRFTAILGENKEEIAEFWSNYSLTVENVYPNPDMPQDIENANDSGMTLTLHGTNLATAYQMFEGNQDYTELEFKGRNAIRYRCGDYTYHTIEGGYKENTQYTISGYFYTALNPQYGGEATDGGYLYFVRYTDGTTSPVNSILIWNSNAWVKHSLTTEKGKTVANIGMKSSGYKAFVYVDVDSFQINEGTKELPYESYYREAVEIPTSVTVDGVEYPLRMSEYNSIEVDSLNKKVTYHRMEYYKEFNGTENFVIHAWSYNNGYGNHYLFTSGVPLVSVCSNCFKTGKWTLPQSDNTVVVTDSYAIIFTTDNEMTLEEFKALLAEKYAVGTPVYMLAKVDSSKTFYSPYKTEIDLTNTGLGQALLNLNLERNLKNIIEVSGNESAGQAPIDLTYFIWGGRNENDSNT